MSPIQTERMVTVPAEDLIQAGNVHKLREFVGTPRHAGQLAVYGSEGGDGGIAAPNTLSQSRPSVRLAALMAHQVGDTPAVVKFRVENGYDLRDAMG